MDHVWTFHIHQHMVDMSTFTLHVLRHFDITHYLNGQPLQSMIKDRCAPACVTLVLKFSDLDRCSTPIGLQGLP